MLRTIQRQRVWPRATPLAPTQVSATRSITAEASPEKVTVTWDSGRTTEHSAMWLRDHCQCEACTHSSTLQRLLDISIIPEDISVNDVTVNSTDAVVMLNDGHQAKFSSRWLERNGYPCPPNNKVGLNYKATPWDGNSLNEIPSLPVSVLDSDDGMADCLGKLRRYGCVIVSNVEPSVEATKAVCETITYVRQTFWGGMWEFTADMSKADTAYTSLGIPPHTDGTYLDDPPGYQVFQCLVRAEKGGDTVLADGLHIANTFKAEHPEDYDVLASTPLHFDFVDAKTKAVFSQFAPIFELLPNGDLHQFRFNELCDASGRGVSWPRSMSYRPISAIGTTWDAATTRGQQIRTCFAINPTIKCFLPNTKFTTNTADRSAFHFAPSLERKVYRALRKLNHAVMDPQNHFTISLTPGNVLIFDNWRVLHSRTEFTGSRRLTGCYLPREDVVSKTRALLDQWDPDTSSFVVDA